ncbi:MAG TPA: hypothetical protein VLA34_08200 [Candidatus Krumholzibacterium sp.]|nr:hypothetical protein [Candidatus Krumholzibacterium sp.]
MADRQRQELNDQGKNHELTLKVDSAKGTVTSGALYNFSDNSSLRLDLTRGRVGGSFVHTGDLHSLRLDLSSSGRYNGTYRTGDSGGLELEIKAGVVRVRKGVFPPEGHIAVRSGGYSLKLTLDSKGMISGNIKSKLPGAASFELDISRNRVSGLLSHKGKRHETTLKLSGSGWKGRISLKKGRSSLRLDLAGGKDLKLSSARLDAVLKF